MLAIAIQPRCPSCEPELVGGVDAVQRLAVDVELQLVGGAVADPHRARAAVALPVVERLLDEVGGAVDAVHDVQRAAVAAGALPRPGPAASAPNAAASSVNPRPSSAYDREGGVADPGVAVVPVALAADLLGQAGGRCRDQSAGRRVGHQLERDRRAVDHLPPAAAVGRAGEPGPPERRPCSSNSRWTSATPDLPRRPVGRRLEHDAARLPAPRRQRRVHVAADVRLGASARRRAPGRRAASAPMSPAVEDGTVRR